MGAADPEEAQLAALTRALELATGFKLLLARANLPRTRQRITAELRRRPDLQFGLVGPPGPDSSLLDLLRRHLSAPSKPDVLVVMGLERSVPTPVSTVVLGGAPPNDPRSPFVTSLNSSRNALVAGVGVPLLLWVSDLILVQLGPERAGLLVHPFGALLLRRLTGGVGGDPTRIGGSLAARPFQPDLGREGGQDPPPSGPDRRPFPSRGRLDDPDDRPPRPPLCADRPV